MKFLNAAILLLSIGVLISCKSKKERLAEQIRTNEEKLFNDSTRMLDPKVANDELEAYRKYVSDFPDDTASPGYLFKAADLAHGMRKSREAARLYKDFIAKYPTHQKIATSQFLLAFVYDNDLKQKDSAKIFYREFLEKFPTHQLAPSAKASLDQIEMGLTDEELVRMFEARLDSSKGK
jgi:TolA-binding protein